jgi:hypothetical protein
LQLDARARHVAEAYGRGSIGPDVREPDRGLVLLHDALRREPLEPTSGVARHLARPEEMPAPFAGLDVEASAKRLAVRAPRVAP